MFITEELKLKVWEKGIVVDKYPSNRVRKDACGAFILFEDFGNRNSIFGWEIDHIIPVSELKNKNIPDAKIDHIYNLRPLNCKNNASKGDNYPYYTARCVANDSAATNVETSEGKVVHENIQNLLKSLYSWED